MDSTSSDPLTRKDLQEELHLFAHSLLGNALRAALQEERDAIASKVHGLVTAENGSSPELTRSRSSSFDFGRRESDAMAQTVKRRNSAYVFEFEQEDRSSIWQPALKYEAQNNFRLDPITDVTPEFGEESQAEVGYGVSFRSSSRDVVSGNNLPLCASLSINHNQRANWQAKIKKTVESAGFEQCSGMIVILNAVALGIGTDYLAAHPGKTNNTFSVVTEQLFCVLFLLEWLLRVTAFGGGFFVDDGWKVNWFDTLLVACQVFEQIMLLCKTDAEHIVNLGVLRLMRLLQVIRFTRLFRVIHLFDDLRVIVSSVIASMSSLGSSLFLFLILIYVFSLITLQCVVSAGHTEHHEELEFYFASLARTFLTMFECVVGGVNWDHVVRPLIDDISPMMAVLFCFYVATSLFAIMNILTGIFVDKAMQSVREDKDAVLARRVRDIFYPKELQETDEKVHIEVTWETFSEKLDSPAMKDYFKQIHVEIEEARTIFDLIDMDGSGTLSAEEIVRACLRFRGPARSLDLMMLTKDVHDIFVKVCTLEATMNPRIATRRGSGAGATSDPRVATRRG